MVGNRDLQNAAEITMQFGAQRFIAEKLVPIFG
jgi:hypothetical protein